MKIDIISSLQVATQPPAELEVLGKTFKLALDMNAVVKANAELNRDNDGKKLSAADAVNWLAFDTLQLTVILWAALQQNHPEISLDEVRTWINPGLHNALFALLFEHAFPGRLEKINKVTEGKTEPNLPAAAAASK